MSFKVDENPANAALKAYDGEERRSCSGRRICCAPGWKPSRGIAMDTKISRGRHTIRLAYVAEARTRRPSMS